MSNDTDPIQSAGPEALGRSRANFECREIAPGVHFLAGFGNTTIIIGTEGVAVVDPGLFTNGPRVVNELRALTDLPVRYVIYTHGHYDHAFGTPALLEDAAQRGHQPPDIVGHVNVAKRFERYAKTSGHLAGTFDSQFACGDPTAATLSGRPGTSRRPWPTRTAYSWTAGRSAARMPPWARGDGRPHLGLARRGPCHRGRRLHRVVIAKCRDAVPCAALRAGVGRSPRGDGRPRASRHRLRPRGVFRDHGVEMLLTTAKALRYLDGEVVRRLNEGQWQEQILTEVELPAELAASSYLQPLYGCTPFLVRDLMRRYMGWYDGNPSMLFPSTRAKIAGRGGPPGRWDRTVARPGPGPQCIWGHRRHPKGPSPGRLRAVQRRRVW